MTEHQLTGGLQFAVLGAFRADRDGQAVPLGPRLQRTLLAILVVEARHVVPADRLVGLLWHDEPPGAATASLQAYISQLRRVLEPGRLPRAPAQLLLTQDPGYLLQAADDQVDALRFQRLARQAHSELEAGDPAAAVARLEQALALWRGDPLAEFAGEPWAVPAAARLTEAHDLALEDRAGAWLVLGKHAQATSELEAMVQDRPLRERRWEQLIVAAYRSGRQADALRAYQRCRTVLGDELGLEPGPGLRRLEAAVLAQDPALDWEPAGVAPVVAGHPFGSSVGSTPVSEAPGRTPPGALGPGPLVLGRDAELARLADRLRLAGAGHGGAVVLTGEPGAGKTTVAEAVAHLAEQAGITVAWARCPDADSAPAYWPWSQVLRALPDGPRVQAARSRLDGDVAGADEESIRQFRAYEAVAAALAEAAAGGTVLAVIDDLHAADDASLGLLQLLAGDLRRMPVLGLFTARDTEPSRSLGQALGELLRQPGTERMAVEAFSAADVAALLDRLIAQQASAEVIAALMSRTGGNPFYTTELVRLISSEQRRRALTAADVLALDVPSGIRDVLMRRVGRLPDDTQSLLTLAAVAGRELVPELLGHVAGLDAEQLLFNLEPAVAAGLVAPAEAGWGFRFRHPLIHESLYASIGPAAQARLHGRCAAALEDLSSAPTAADVAQLAHHYLAAGPFGDPAKAVSYAREAAARAVRQGAWQDALRHLREALAVISGSRPGADATRCDVLTELGLACRSAGMIAGARAALSEAVSLAGRIGDEDRVLTAAIAFGAPALWGSREWGEPDTGLVPLLERQLSRVADTDPSRRIRILSTLATELAHDHEADHGWRYATEALEAARRLGRPAELSAAVNAYLVFAHMTDRQAEGRQVMDEMLDGRHDLSVPVQALLRANLLTERIRSADLARFDAEFPLAWRLACDELRSPELQGQLRFIQSSRYLVAGDISLATDAAERGFGDLAKVTTAWDQPSRFVYESCLMLITGTLGDHAEELAARIVRPEHPSVPHLAAPAAALGLAWRGDRPRAREITERWFTPPPRAWTRFQAIAYWAQVAIELGVPDPGWLYDQLLPRAGQLAIVGTGVDCGGAVDSLLAGLAWRLGRLDAAAEYAQAGLALDQRVGSPMWITRSSKLLAQIIAA
jgi:DNA-binding SARP family transcriptional activator/energy-coupling factor transporter ATP-binding protein EcfA2